jgi:ribosomal protein S7
MPRKGIKTAKVVKPNLERLINNVMMHGKKRKAENIVQKALDHVIKHLPSAYEMPEDMVAHKNANNVLQLKVAYRGGASTGYGEVPAHWRSEFTSPS